MARREPVVKLPLAQRKDGKSVSNVTTDLALMGVQCASSLTQRKPILRQPSRPFSMDGPGVLISMFSPFFLTQEVLGTAGIILAE